MGMMRLPRLLDGQMNEIARLQPSSLQINLTLSGLSTAVMTLPDTNVLISLRQFVELYTSDGSAGIFRISGVEAGPESGVKITMQHGLCTLSDHLMPGEGSAFSTAENILSQMLDLQGDNALWRLGDAADTGDIHWSWDSSNLLVSLFDLMEELPGYFLKWDQSSLPWKLHLMSPENDDDLCEARLSRNVTGLSIHRDDSALCTRLYVGDYPTPIDADTQSAWGVISRRVTLREELTYAQQETLARAWLEAHKHPRLTVTIDAAALSSLTGCPLDEFSPGRMCRVCLPEEGVSLTQRIVALKYPDLVSDPHKVQVVLCNDAPNPGASLSGLEVTAAVFRQKVRKRLKYCTDRIDVVTDTLTLQAESLDAVIDEMSVQSNDISILTRDLDLQAKEISTQAERIDTVAEDVSTQAQRITTQAQRIDTVAEDISTQANRITTEAGRIDTLTNNLNTQAGKINTQAGRITTLTNNLNTQAGKINTQAGQITTLTNNLSTQAGRIDTLAEDISTQAERIDTLANDVSVHAQNLTAITDTLTLHTSTLDLKADKVTLDANITAVGKFFTGETKAEVIRASTINTEDLWVTNDSHFALLTADTFVVSGTVVVGDIDVTWKEVSAITGITMPSYSVQTSTINYINTSGQAASKTVVTGISRDSTGGLTRTTLKYLGGN
ncbi:MAG: hypothetical protein E7333_07980 [Clostridiales bacterium]|nr:hypothetical protein [Clostridiales bacterium]